MRKAPISEITCEYNEGVSCTDYPDCGKCGWNPDNIEARKEKAKEKYLVQGKYLNVLDEEVSFVLRRKPNGAPYIAARAGMFVIAVFRPYYDPENNLASWLAAISQQMKNTKQIDAVALEVNADEE